MVWFCSFFALFFLFLFNCLVLALNSYSDSVVGLVFTFKVHTHTHTHIYIYIGFLCCLFFLEFVFFVCWFIVNFTYRFILEYCPICTYLKKRSQNSRKVFTYTAHVHDRLDAQSKVQKIWFGKVIEARYLNISRT